MTWFGHQVAAPPLAPNHFIARSGAELEHMVRALRSAPDRAFDFEANGLRYANREKHVIGYGVGYIASDGRPYSWYVPLRHQTGEAQADPGMARAAFRDALKGARSLIGHHLKFDLNMGRGDGWEIPEDADIHDTLPQAHLVYEKRRFSLEDVVATTPACGVENPFAAKEVVTDFLRERAKLHRLPFKKDNPSQGRASYMSRFGHAEVPVVIEGEYCCRDVEHTLLLDRVQRPIAMGIGEPYEPQRRYLYENEMLLVRALADMEWEGQVVDAEYLRSYAGHLDIELEQRAADLSIMFGGVSTDFGNDNEVRSLLYGHLNIPVKERTATGQPAVDRGTLLQLRQYHPGIEYLAEYALRAKVRSTYTHSLAWRVDEDDRIHASFVQQGTVTGRLSARDPNLQNIPSREKELSQAIRRAFKVAHGMARIYIDYSQIELRMLAWVVQSRNFMRAYASPAYEALLRGQIDYETYRRERAKEPKVDAHGDQAKAVFGVDESHPDWKRKRGASKIVNFGSSYGMGPSGLMRNPELQMDEPEAVAFYRAFHEKNPEIRGGQQGLIRRMRRNGAECRGEPFFVNWAGRKVHSPEILSPISYIQKKAERSAFAALIQGSAGELTRFSLVALWKARKNGVLPARATSTVHDEIQLDCERGDVPEVARRGQEIMEDTFRGRFGFVPTIADVEVTYTNWAEKEEYRT